MGTITSANATYTLVEATQYPSGVTLQQFSTDDMFDAEAVKNVELQMGIDGILSAGFVFVEIPQTITLMGNSVSNDVFDDIYNAQIAGVEALPLSAVILMPSISRQWTCTNGFLTSYKPMPGAKKTLQPRTYQITWNAMTVSVLGS